MPGVLQGKHFLSLAEMSGKDLADLVRLARDMRERRQVGLNEPLLANKTLVYCEVYCI